MGARGTPITEGLVLPKLPRVKIVKVRGRAYAYFCSGRKPSGDPITHPLPSIQSEEFMAEYNRLMALHKASIKDTYDGSGAERRIRAGQRRSHRGGARQKVYFIGSRRAGFVKIGTTCRPKQRLSTLQVGHPGKLSILAIIDGDENVERAYHKRFADWRVYGEWFRLNKPLKAEIRRLNNEKNKTGERNR